MSQSWFVSSKLNGYKYCYLALIVRFSTMISRKLFNTSIWPIDENFIDSDTTSQLPGSNSNEEVFHILKAPRLEPYHQIV